MYGFVEVLFLGLPLVGLVAVVVFLVRSGGPPRGQSMDRAGEQARAEAGAWEGRLGNTLEM